MCDEFGYANYDKFAIFLNDVERATVTSLRDIKEKVIRHQQFMKCKFSKQAERHSPCLKLCMDHAFGECNQAHDSCSDAVFLHEVVRSVNVLLATIHSADDRKKLSEQYVGHLLRTKHQADYYKFILNNLQPGEAVVTVDYKMKLELGVRTREIQRDWYGKRGMSLHGFLVIALFTVPGTILE